jgi:hydroxymethylpyrimidine/phosphomethylpyrimidine kinase
MRTALTIAGSDSGGGAGIQADLKTFAAHHVHGTSAVTAVTAQNTRGITCVHALPADLVAAQIEAVVSDMGVHAVKTGVLVNAAIVETVAAAVQELEIPLLVVDPVMIATSGERLLDDEALWAIRAELLRRAFVVTPNISEAEALADLTIRSEADRREAARRIQKLGAARVIIKGGHFPTDDVVDLLYDGHRFVDFRTVRVAGPDAHGSGCTFSAAIVAHLALGRSLEESIPAAQEYVAGAMRNGFASGHGRRVLNHFWRSLAG